MAIFDPFVPTALPPLPPTVRNVMKEAMRRQNEQIQQDKLRLNQMVDQQVLRAAPHMIYPPSELCGDLRERQMSEGQAWEEIKARLDDLECENADLRARIEALEAFIGPGD